MSELDREQHWEKSKEFDRWMQLEFEKGMYSNITSMHIVYVFIWL